jgi:peptidoglycan/xylan/chitin deacetylase (PgdA/CDA1 family)
VSLSLLFGALNRLPADPRVSRGRPLAYVEAALAKLNRGDYAGAAHQTRLALQADATGGLPSSMAGVLLLRSGQFRLAQTVFENVVKTDPGDGLALYGLGMAHMAQGDQRAALGALDRCERAGGDPSYLLAARRYAQWLDGAQVAPGDAGLPEAFGPILRALEGMSRLRRGDADGAATALETALRSLPGDGIREPQGLLLTFDTAHPVLADGTLPGGSDLNVSAAPQAGVHGQVEFTPQDPEPQTTYVSYEIDGQSLDLINVRPFAYVCDTTRLENGTHRLTIVLYDAQGSEIRRATRTLQVANPASGRDGQTSVLRAGIWEALLPRPDRFGCEMALARIRVARHDTQGARAWIERAAAVRPDDAVRQQWAACGGVTHAGEALWGGRPDEKVVALTFDDGPKPGITEPLLDLLVKSRVPATFFVIGRHVLEFPDLTRRITADGMEIANHSFTHPNLTHLSLNDVGREVMATQAAVEQVTGITPRYLRPPGGNWNAQVAGVVRSWGLTPCMWTVDAYGAEVIGPQQTADAVLQQVQPGSIILMHNGKLSTLEALPTIIRELKARGYSFATVSALAERLELARAEARQAAHNASLHPSRGE